MTLSHRLFGSANWPPRGWPPGEVLWSQVSQCYCGLFLPRPATDARSLLGARETASVSAARRANACGFTRYKQDENQGGLGERARPMPQGKESGGLFVGSDRIHAVAADPMNRVTTSRPTGDSMESLQGRVAIITGASRGIGRAIALGLARHGCHIVVAAKSVESTERLPGSIYSVAHETEAFGAQALPVQVDVRDADQIDALAAKATERFGRIDILINNAGALSWRPVLETSAKRFDLVMGVNARAAFLTSRAVLPSMIVRNWGHIINMSPPIDLKIIPGKVAYFISKFGMTLLTHGLAEEVREHNIAVNSLWPVTIIESQASINLRLGSREMWRKPDILVDCVLRLVQKEPATISGKALLDEDFLRGEGVTDFSQYACVPGTQPLRIPW